MRFFTARSLALAALVPALVLFVLVPGCAKQSEGERCGDTLGAAASDDCGDNLTCKYIGPNKGDNRCCYTDGHINDARCEPYMSTGSGGTGGGGAATAGVGGAVTTGGGGAATAGGGAAVTAGGGNSGSDSVAGGSSEAGAGGS